ncbi:ferredoxin [Candidatus Micrarchaeota archaeon]|nr:ferredoxin [Candidatus Micrarchaeota archaeon]
MAKYRVTFDKELCVGAGYCASADPQDWHVNLYKDGGDGKAELAGATLNPQTGLYELIVDEAGAERSKKAEAVCPVLAIKVEKVE